MVDLLIKDDRKCASGAGKISGKFEHRDELRRTSSGKTEDVQRAFMSIKLYSKDQSWCSHNMANGPENVAI